MGEHAAGRTLAEKVWDEHVVAKGENGAPDLLYIDLHLIHEVTSPQANKGQALVTLAAFLGVDLAHTAALGDGGNDPAMFHKAGLSIAMGQAQEEVRRQADRVTASNVDDGAAQAIERYILAR